MALQSAELTGQLLVQSRQLQQSYRIVGELSLVLQAYMEGNIHTYRLVQLQCMLHAVADLQSLSQQLLHAGSVCADQQKTAAVYDACCC